MRCRKQGPGCGGCERPVCAAEFAAELRGSIAAGEMSARFVELAEQAARLWYSQPSAAGWKHSVEDVISDFRLKLVRKWEALDPEQNLFAWCQTTVRRCGMDAERARRGMTWRDELREKLLTELAESGVRPGVLRAVCGPQVPLNTSLRRLRALKALRVHARGQMELNLEG